VQVTTGRHFFSKNKFFALCAKKYNSIETTAELWPGVVLAYTEGTLNFNNIKRVFPSALLGWCVGYNSYQLAKKSS